MPSECGDTVSPKFLATVIKIPNRFTRMATSSKWRNTGMADRSSENRFNYWEGPVTHLVPINWGNGVTKLSSKADLIKDRFGRGIWFVGPVFVSAVWGVLFTWNIVIIPALTQYEEVITNIIQVQLKDQLSSLRKVVEENQKFTKGRFEPR